MEADQHEDAELYIPLSALTECLQAIGATLKLPEDQVYASVRLISEKHDTSTESLPWKQWQHMVKALSFDGLSQLRLTNLAIALVFLRESERQGTYPSPIDLDQVWNLVSDALQYTGFAWKTLQSADGSLAVPLWASAKDGNVRTIIDMCVWLPGAVRVDPGLVSHKRRPFAGSWVLAGEASYHILDAASHGNFAVFKRYMSVQNPNGDSYRIEVEPDALHATISLYDSSQSQSREDSVPGSQSHEESSIYGQSADLGAAEITVLISDLRSWETLQDTGLMFSDQGEWEDALRVFRTALHKCKSNPWLNRPRYKHITLRPIGKMFRMLGRYDDARDALEETVVGAPLTPFRVDSAGELAMIYRHMDDLQTSKRYAEEQYEGAKRLHLEKFACRAIGNVGRANYQLYMESEDKNPALLSLAIDQLNERVERAKRFGDIVLEAIGYSCLSLCYIEKKDYEEAVRIAQKNYDLTCRQSDATKVGFAKAFLGRALLRAGRKDKALALFNEPHGCSPIIALTKEISGEHRRYIQEMIDVGADLKLRDEQGYSALECAVYNGDNKTTEIIEQGLKTQIKREGEEQLKLFKYEATLRKGYRDIFQDELRPVLLEGKKESALQELRQTYAKSLADEVDKQKMFDGLKYVPYANFVRRKQMPRSSDGDTEYYSDNHGGVDNPFIIFFSYRWIAKDHSNQVPEFFPDDAAHTQYNRMLKAINLFLELHPNISRDQLGIWIVSPHLPLIETILNLPGLCLHKPVRQRLSRARCRCTTHELIPVQCHDKPD